MTMHAPRTASETTANGYREQLPQDRGDIAIANEVPKIVEVACRFAEARQRKAVVYILGAGDVSEDRPDVPMTKRTVEHLESALGDQRFDGLDLIIQSSGGDIHAAYHMMSLLRERMDKDGRLIACVSSRAQSAATLLCLGADQILLGELGSLGPLDAQIRKGVTDVGTPNYVSALHLLKGLSRLQQFSLESFNAMAAHLQEHQASHDEQIKYGIEFIRAISGPLFERIDSESVGYWDQMLETGEEYGRRLLTRGDLVEDDDNAMGRADRISTIVNKLVFGYPSHEIVIDQEVLNGLHLKAELLPEPVRPIARRFAAYAGETLIMLVDPKGVPAPEGTAEIKLKAWSSIGTTEPTRDIVWKGKDSTFAMRVSLYRPTIMPRNPWRERALEGRPAAAYSVPSGYTSQ